MMISGPGARLCAPASGQMMRPLLVVLMARELGDVSVDSLRSAVTLELLHTASLVHDDVVDESGERRGQRSVNAVYDNKVAVLVGDYLLSTSLLQAAMTGNIGWWRLFRAWVARFRRARFASWLISATRLSPRRLIFISFTTKRRRSLRLVPNWGPYRLAPMLSMWRVPSALARL